MERGGSHGGCCIVACWHRPHLKSITGYSRRLIAARWTLQVRRSVRETSRTGRSTRLQSLVYRHPDTVQWWRRRWRSKSMTHKHADRHWLSFLLLARYVPNVAKRSIWDQCKKKYSSIYWGPTDRRPMADQRPTSHFGKFPMAISPRGVVRSTSCLVLQWSFRGWRIEWRYFRFRQIQDGGSAAILKNPNDDISAADHPIYSVFGSKTGFSGSADRMAIIPVWPNSIGMWEKTMCEE